MFFYLKFFAVLFLLMSCDVLPDQQRVYNLSSKYLVEIDTFENICVEFDFNSSNEYESNIAEISEFITKNYSGDQSKIHQNKTCDRYDLKNSFCKIADDRKNISIFYHKDYESAEQDCKNKNGSYI